MERYTSDLQLLMIMLFFFECNHICMKWHEHDKTLITYTWLHRNNVFFLHNDWMMNMYPWRSLKILDNECFTDARMLGIDCFDS